MKTIFEKKYDGESIVDVYRDVSEAFEEDFNPLVNEIPKDKYGFQKGTFKVAITWMMEEQE